MKCESRKRRITKCNLDGCLKVGVVVTAVEFVQNLPDRLVFAIHEVWITCGETLGFHPHSCAGLRVL